MTALLLTAAAAGLYGGFGRASTAQAQPQPAAAADDPCGKLAGLKLDGVEIVSAVAQSAKAPVEGARMPSMTGIPGGGPPVAGLPAFCRVVGAIHPEAGSDIRFEVWLPSDGWTGRMTGVGNGGLAGSIGYNDLASAVRAGQVGAATDAGHEANPEQSAWAKGHPERVRDYGWRAIHLTAVTAKTLAASYYGHAPDRTYFIGCSNGGRAALMEASRFPNDYDGILAGAPAAPATDLIMSQISVAQAQLPPGAAIRPEQVKLLQSEVLKQCDALDGQVDGLVADPRQCKFDASRLACGVNNSPLCFSPAQIAAVRKIHAGPHDSAGRRVAFGYPATGSEVGVPVPFFGWDGAIAKGGRSPAQPGGMANGALQDFPAKPIATEATFDFDKDPARFRAALSKDLDPQPDLRRFFARGGKLIMWHGWADATIPPTSTVAFHQRILSASGPKAKAQLRLFMVPGVGHCAGGPGPDSLGQIGAPLPSDTPERSLGAALVAWVEKNRTPDQVIGRQGLTAMAGGRSGAPAKERLICASPAHAVLRTGADPDKGDSYACQFARAPNRAKAPGATRAGG